MKSESKVILIVLFLSVFTMLVSCQKQKAAWKGTIEEVDGVTIVKNPKEPMYGRDAIKIEEELTIGEAEGREEYLFENLWWIVVDDKDRIFISEGAGNRAHIKVFNSSGDYLMTIGRRGEGPGEFNQIANIQITPENELMVHDRYARRLTFFSLDGDYLRTALLKEIQAFRIKVNSMGNYLVRTIDFDSATFRAATELKIYSSDLAFIRTIVKDKFWSTEAPLQPYMAAKFLPSDLIICGFRESYEFQILDSEGKTVRKVLKDYSPIKISDSEKEIRGITKEETPKYFPAFEDFSLDEEGRLFVKTYERHEDGELFLYDVFDSEGRYIIKTQLPVLPTYWKNGKMYTIEEDESGFQYVKRYKVTWKY